MKKVLYEELLPEECVQRIKEMPVAICTWHTGMAWSAYASWS